MQKHLKKSLFLSALLILIASWMTACSTDVAEPGEQPDQTSEEGGAESNGESAEEPWAYHGDPVTLKMLIWIDEITFNSRYKEQIEAQFPNIKLELISGNPVGSEFIQELIAKGEMPDINVGNPSKELVENLDFLMPIDEYIEKTNFDLSIFQEGIVDNLRSLDPLGQGHLYGLPVENSVRALFYNKDIFDLFGEPYPEDDMTWDEVLEIASRLTVNREGVQYRGLVLAPNSTPFMQLGVPGTDPQTGEIVFADDPRTKKFFELLDRYRSIPGIVNPDTKNNPDGFSDGKQNIAMWVNNSPWLELLTRVEGFNFDMAAVPTWADMPNIAPTWGALPFNITKHSKNKDAAWSVISYLASEQGQIALSQAGSPPVIKSEEAIREFTSMHVKEEYNVTAPFSQTLAKLAPYSPYDESFSDFIATKSAEFLTSDQDAVQFIRKIAEEYSVIVDEVKGRK